MVSHFEAMTPGMEAKLNPGYRLLASREKFEYSELMKEIQEIGVNLGQSVVAVRKENIKNDRVLIHHNKLW
ncbi:hypothetical protein ACFLXH_05840 [Chloroflexota bacterium]